MKTSSRLGTRLLRLLAALATLSACAPGSKSATVSPPPSDVPFRWDREEELKLSRTGCHVEARNVTCDAAPTPTPTPTPEDSENPLVRMSQTLNRENRQIEALREAQETLETQIKAGVVPARERNDARLFSTTLMAARLGLIAKTAGGEARIATEKLYQTIIGYQCDGSFLRDRERIPTSNLLVFTEGRGPEATALLSVKDSGDIGGELKILPGSRAVGLKFEDASSEPASSLGVYVQTDGEFRAESKGAARLDLSCLRRRAAGTVKTFSDRTLDKRRWTCMTNSDIGASEPKQKPETTGWTLEFNVPNSDQNVVSDLGGPPTEGDAEQKKFMSDSIYARLPYGIHVVSDQGILKFQVTDRKTKALLFEVTTLNSTPKIALGLSDKLGNAVRLVCGNHVKM